MNDEEEVSVPIVDFFGVFSKDYLLNKHQGIDFVKEIELIKLKKSNLSRSDRDEIGWLFDNYFINNNGKWDLKD